MLPVDPELDGSIYKLNLTGTLGTANFQNVGNVGYAALEPQWDQSRLQPAPWSGSTRASSRSRGILVGTATGVISWPGTSAKR